MRSLLACIAVLLSVTLASGQMLGDAPRTYSHYLNSQEAAFCRANAATGGVGAYFLNPAAVAALDGASGQATIRFNIKSRDYLGDTDPGLEAEDDGILFSQLVAAKSLGQWVVGFAYSSPSYRRLDLAGTIEGDGGPVEYEGQFRAGLKYFELLGAVRIGTNNQGALGASLGLASVNESVREVEDHSLASADVSGMGGSGSVGFLFDATPSLSFGAGYRWGTTVDVNGEWYGQERRTGTTSPQSAYVVGLGYDPVPSIGIHVSYVGERWDTVSSTLSAYEENDGERGGFSEPIAIVAFGVESRFGSGKTIVRGGVSKEIAADMKDSIVPDLAVGLGAAYAFDMYFVDVAGVWESFKYDGESGRLKNVGVYVTVGYDF